MKLHKTIFSNPQSQKSYSFAEYTKNNFFTTTRQIALFLPKMKKKCYIHYIFTLWLSFIIFACEPNHTEKGKISVEETIKILEDLNLARSFVTNEPSMSTYDQQALFDEYKQDIFEKHNTSEEEFLEILKEYASDPKQIYGIIQALKDTVTAQKNRYFQKDSIQWRSHIVLHALSSIKKNVLYCSSKSPKNYRLPK